MRPPSPCQHQSGVGSNRVKPPWRFRAYHSEGFKQGDIRLDRGLQELLFDALARKNFSPGELTELIDKQE